ncbi:DivIVA domain-containing protein [Amycolatopsis sp. NPDC049253]|uniref:DivIVA domain-containing protein n=1 Tax=Amycolatopsis sp. NPDC049253 TaxID=3155274 RepID=UPI0034141038
MAPEDGEDLMSVEPRFDPAWRGYHRGQVKEFVAWAQEELRRVAAERDAAMRRVARLAEHNRELHATIDRISRTPIEADALQERSRRMIELTREEASEIIARAKEKAEQTRLDAEAEAVRLTEKERALVAAAEEDRRRQQAAHDEFMRRAAAERAAADEAAATQRRRMEEDLTAALHQRRIATITELDTQRTKTLRELDAHRTETVRNLNAQRTETLRKLETERVETERALAAQRTETLRDLENQRAETHRVLAAQIAEAQAEADTLVRRAAEHANDIVTQADDRVAELTAIHHRLKTALTGTRELLASATAALDPQPGGTDTAVPVQRRKPALTEATTTG